MNTVVNKKHRQLPGAAAHVFASAFALLLTLLVFLGSCMLLMTNLLTGRETHYQIAGSPEIVDAQMDVIGKRVGYVAEDNKLNADDIMPTRESVLNYGRQIVDWWTGLFGQGPDLQIPMYDLDHNDETDDELPQEVREELTDIVERTVFPLRRQLMDIGLPLMMKYADLYNISRYLPYITAALWLLGLVAAGLIALLLSRRMFVSLQYIGGGLGAGGLSVACVPLLIKSIGLDIWLEQANRVLFLQFTLLTRVITVWTVIFGAVLLIAGIVCIGVYRKKMRDMENKTDRGGKAD